MGTNGKQFWFPAKKYGWGWSFPCCWQGWVVFAAFFVLLGGGGFFLAPNHIVLYVVYAIVLSIAFCLVVFVKGEKPGWRWGKD